jgi:hypothetical protein
MKRTPAKRQDFQAQTLIRIDRRIYTDTKAEVLENSVEWRTRNSRSDCSADENTLLTCSARITQTRDPRAGSRIDVSIPDQGEDGLG